LINDKLQVHTSDEWEEILNAHGIPCGPIYDMEQSLEHPQIQHREMVVELPHPTMGSVRLLGLPVKLSETPGAIFRTPPLFGQHTDEVLREIGVTDAELLDLRASGVITSGAASARAAADGSAMPGKEAT
jgi:crotonobetainyl-CoA:carnitine CoA-transferase CaiB-like acyl-CoA transferase